MIALKPDVTLDELRDYVLAAIELRLASHVLREARLHWNAPQWRMRLLEKTVCTALDRLWEEQKHVAAIYSLAGLFNKPGSTGGGH